MSDTPITDPAAADPADPAPDHGAVDRPSVRLQPGRQKRVRGGHPWVYSNEIDMTAEAKALPPGTVVDLVDANGGAVGTALFNPRPLISARLLSPRTGQPVDAAFVADALGRARDLRDRLFAAPYYRLVHAEADGLPGLVVDRYGDVCVVQLNTAGMDRLAADVVDALRRVLAPAGLVVQRDGAGRRLEGLDEQPPEILGEVPPRVPLVENGVCFAADLAGGQKTGWFYDHRENRARFAGLSRDRRVLDVYCYLGGFGLQAAAAGARDVTAIDRSQPALDLAAESAAALGVADACRFEKAEAFGALERLAADGERYGAVVADPPAFVKGKKDLKPGARAYRKLARLTAALVEPQGILCLASCSHHVDAALFAEQASRGLQDAGRTGRILHAGGAGPDHPVHPRLPESAYLKCLFLQLD